MFRPSKWLQHAAVAFVHDGVMAYLSFWGALILRVGGNEALATPHVWYAAALFMLVCVAVFAHMRLYRGIWHFASVEDLLTIVKAVSLSMLVFAAGMFIAHRLEGVPRSVLLLNWTLLIVLLGAPRFAYRMIKDRVFLPRRDHHAVPLLLVGMDHQTDLFVRDVLRDTRSMYSLVGVVDFTSTAARRSLHGVTVYGRMSPEALGTLVAKLKRKGKAPQRLVLTNTADAGILAQCMRVADAEGLSLSQLPRLQALGSATEGRRLTPIAVEDLLGRTQHVHDMRAMHALVHGKTVLVTGAGGSIGGALCQQLAEYGPAQLVLLDHAEYALYSIDQALAEQAPHVPRLPLLVDVRDVAALDRACRQTRPHLMFHAAAVKHVPLAESNPLPAIQTNVYGTRCVLDAAIAHGAEAMVLISTDKAVNPTNVMGASKRLAETLLLSRRALPRKTRLITVRFGNVLGSTGSVVPLFEKQLHAGGPLTVTHPEMTRYFMTIKEASQLVIRAAALPGEGLYVLDMGTPMNITDLARNMIRLAGKIPGQDVDIVYTGLRPGEKLYEELFYPAEHPEPTVAPGVLGATLGSIPEGFEAALASLEASCKQGAQQDALSHLKHIVPDYV